MLQKVVQGEYLREMMKTSGGKGKYMMRLCLEIEFFPVSTGLGEIAWFFLRYACVNKWLLD